MSKWTLGQGTEKVYVRRLWKGRNVDVVRRWQIFGMKLIIKKISDHVISFEMNDTYIYSNDETPTSPSKHSTSVDGLGHTVTGSYGHYVQIVVSPSPHAFSRKLIIAKEGEYRGSSAVPPMSRGSLLHTT
jgi:hypothetical protein